MLPERTAAPPFDRLLAEARAEAALDRRSFFVALTQGEAAFSRDDFVETQIQFLFAVVFFGEPLRLLAERLPPGAARDALLRNVHDEAGAGDGEQSHEATFLLLLQRLGVPRTEIDRRALWPEARAFDDALVGLATHDDVTVALAAFGMIEDCFAVLSARLGQALVDRRFLPREAVVHYAVHETLDHAHAAGFFDAIRPATETPEGAYAVQQGLALGAYLLLRLFDDLYAARTRRLWHPSASAHPGGIALSTPAARTPTDR